MRHPYVGDVGDFGKYGLLCTLGGGAGVRANSKGGRTELSNAAPTCVSCNSAKGAR